MIDRPTIERIKDAADIVDVVSEFVSLKRVGANYRGLCPFHNDHTPSFYVSPSRRTCHCFVCGEGGDAVGFMMKHEQMTYPDALRWLANRYHIDIQEQEMTDEQKKEQSERDAMFIVNEWAANYFKDILHNDIDGRAIGMQYFRQRGIRDDIIEKFRLGFCLNDRQAMAKAATEKGYKAEYLIKTGLCYAKDSSGQQNPQNVDAKNLIDRFSGRAMFPWIGVSGKVVAFGGRVLDARTKGVSQKYVNSPDSEIYHKERELYGIFQAKKAIAKENCVYMVEGYTDVISMHQCGIENVVANSGTALSVHQIHILHRFTPNIILLYDGDAAGIKAALRGTDMLLREGMNVKVLLLPDGDDPDSFAKKHSAEEFRQYIDDNKTDFIAFKTKVKLEGVSDPRERSEAISSIIQSVSVIGDPIIRAAYIQDCSLRLGISEQILTQKTNEFIRAYREEQRKEEERQRRQGQYQNYQSTGQQPETVTTTAPSPSPSQDPYDMPPPDAFLPPEAFSDSTLGDQTAVIPTTTAAPSQPQSQPYTQPQSQSYTQSQAQLYPQPQTPHTYTTSVKRESVSDLLLKYVIKYGEMPFENAELEDGTTVCLSLAQFVEANLASDGLEFSMPIYNKVLHEASEHSGDEDFKAERYFTLHPEYEISDLAIRLTSDSVLLAKSMQVKNSEDSLKEKVRHLLLDFRQELISAKLSQLQTDIALNSDNPERMLELMAQLQEYQKIRTIIAKKIGRNLR